MKVPGNLEPVNSWLRNRQSVEIAGFEAVAGGSINTTGVVTLSDTRRLFVKLQKQAPVDFFSAEAQGLACLREATSLRVPGVIHADRDFLLLEYLGAGSPGPDFWQRLGIGLAELHHQQHTSFGLAQDNYCGLTRQRNNLTEDGYTFFGSYRLLELAGRAFAAGLLETADLRRTQWLADNLARWIPPQPAVLLHGDLWSGNVHCDGNGSPALIDPACYRGWAEADLAMTTLFGGFGEDFYQAYQATAKVGVEWRERAPLYNLYHLLNHLLLFGGAYLGQVKAVLDRFT